MERAGQKTLNLLFPLYLLRNLSMQLSWAGGDCQGLLRALAGCQLFVVMVPNSGLIKVSARGGADHIHSRAFTVSA
jgi:hypothetical protein